MADLSITPVGADVKPVQGMSLGDVVNLARGAQVYQAQKEILPEQVKQAKLATTGKEQELAQSRVKAIADSQISLINDPLVLMAEENPGAVDKTQLVNLLQKRGRTLGKNLGLPEDKINELLNPYLEQAQNDPAQLRTFLKQRHIEGLDQAGRTSVLAGSLSPVETGAGTTYVQAGEFAPERRGAPVLFARKTLGPGQQIIAGVTDPAGNPTYNILDQYGNVVQTGLLASQLPEANRPLEPVGTAVERVPPPNVRPVPEERLGRLPQPGAISPPPRTGLGPNDYKALQDQVTVTRGTVSNAANALKDIQNVEDFLDVALTGVMSEKANKALSALGFVGLGSAEQKAAAREIVNKSLSSLVMHQNASNNGKFAADLAQTQSANANVSLTDPAIRKVIADTKVLMQHQKDYTQGMDKLIQKYPQFGAFSKALYDTAMNDAYDFKVMEINNIKRDNKLTDEQKRKKFFDYLEKKNISDDEALDLNNKAKFYNDLITGNVDVVDGKLVSAPKQRK
jgi:hypothetical protein